MLNPATNINNYSSRTVSRRCSVHLRHVDIVQNLYKLFKNNYNNNKITKHTIYGIRNTLIIIEGKELLNKIVNIEIEFLSS